MEKLKVYWEKIKTLFGKISKKVKISVVIVLVLIIAAIVVYNATRPYVILVTDMTNSEMSTVLSYLEEWGISDYRVEDGDTILVPEGNENNIKAKLLMEGYPNEGFSYDWYYENVSMLSTESERETAALHTLEQKMAAVVACFDGVKSADVSIALGSDNTFVLDKNASVDATASVFVTMKEGKLLTDQQAEAIRRLVSHAVEGLDIDSVEISDAYGNTYSIVADGTSSTDSSSLKLYLEEQYNNRIRTDVMQVLVPLYGIDNVKVTVHCTVNVDRTVTDSTDVFLPDYAVDGSTNGEGIIGSQVWDDVVVRGDDEETGGTVGTGTNSDLNTYIQDELNPDGSEKTISSSGQIDYDNPRKETYVERTAGYLTDCTVSVSINSTTAGSVDTDALQLHVAKAAGISDEMAQTKISVFSGAFFEEEEDTALFSPDSPIEMWMVYAALGGLVVFLILLFIIIAIIKRRKKKKAIKQAEEERERIVSEMLASVGESVPERAVESSGADVMSLNSEKSMELRRDIRKFADESPEIAAQMIRTLLRGGESDG